MKVAVIGLGVIGKLHADIAAMKADLVAVCDVNEAELSPFKNAEKYTDYTRMLDEVKPDVVHVCTPHYLHAEMVIAALKRGVNVLCEKPLCINEQELEEILKAEQNSSAQLGVCFQNRYLSVNRYVKDFLKENPPCGAMGHVTWSRDKNYYKSSSWRGRKKMEGGGVLINQALHTIDLLQWFCGDVKSLRAQVSNLTLQDEIEVEDTACVLCEGQTPFVFYATNGSQMDFSIEMSVKTQKGMLQITPSCVYLNGEIAHVEDCSTYYVKPCYGYGHDVLIADFYRCVQTGEKFAVDGKEGAKALKIVLAAYASEGKQVEI